MLTTRTKGWAGLVSRDIFVLILCTDRGGVFDTILIQHRPSWKSGRKIRRKQIKIEKENHFVQYQPKYHPWLEKKGSWTFCGHKPCWACLLSFKYFTCWKLGLQVKLTVSPLPTLSTSDKLWCTFGETSHRAQLNEGVIICDPPDMIPPTPKGQGKEILLPAKHRKRKNMNHCF